MNIFIWLSYVKSQSDIINEYLYVALICEKFTIKQEMNILCGYYMSIIWQLQSEIINEYLYVSIICEFLK